MSRSKSLVLFEVFGFVVEGSYPCRLLDVVLSFQDDLIFGLHRSGWLQCLDPFVQIVTRGRGQLVDSLLRDNVKHTLSIHIIVAGLGRARFSEEQRSCSGLEMGQFVSCVLSFRRDIEREYMYLYDSLGQRDAACGLVDALIAILVVQKLIVLGHTPAAFPSRIQLSTLLQEARVDRFQILIKNEVGSALIYGGVGVH